MTRDGLDEFLQNLQRIFLSGDLGELGDHCAWPLVVYNEAGVIVIRGRDDLSRIASQYRAALVAMLVASREIAIEFREPPMNNRFRVTVRVDDFDLRGSQVAGRLVRYFLVEEDGHFKIEMLEYVESGFAIEQVEMIVH